MAGQIQKLTLAFILGISFYACGSSEITDASEETLSKEYDIAAQEFTQSITEAASSCNVDSDCKLIDSNTNLCADGNKMKAVAVNKFSDLKTERVRIKNLGKSINFPTLCVAMIGHSSCGNKIDLPFDGITSDNCKAVCVAKKCQSKFIP